MLKSPLLLCWIWDYTVPTDIHIDVYVYIMYITLVPIYRSNGKTWNSWHWTIVIQTYVFKSVKTLFVQCDENLNPTWLLTWWRLFLSSAYHTYHRQSNLSGSLNSLTRYADWLEFPYFQKSISANTCNRLGAGTTLANYTGLHKNSPLRCVVDSQVESTTHTVGDTFWWYVGLRTYGDMI